MKIESSEITMHSTRDFHANLSRKETLRVWTDNVRSSSPQTNPPPGTDLISISRKYAGSLPEIPQFARQTAKKHLDNDTALSNEDYVRKLIVEKMIEMLTGRKITIKLLEIESPQEREFQNNLQNPEISSPNNVNNAQGWGAEYDFSEAYREKEDLSFVAAGLIETKDGEKINFRVQLSLSREFFLERNISIRAGDAQKIDPLIINFNGTGATLTESKINFDLNSDGRKDQISFAGPGSGFLALDLNNDGIINNGAELFGPESGNGFSELAKYDFDGNRWIDEADNVYGKLRIWTRDSAGNDLLLTLADKNIGAIYLGSIEAKFNMKDNKNALQGEVSKMGVFLKNDGSAGTVQQIDLTI